MGPQGIIYQDDDNYVDSISVSVTQSGHVHQKSPAPSKIPGMTLFCLSLFSLNFLLHKQHPLDSKYVGRTLLSSELHPQTSFLEVIFYVSNVTRHSR